jgi:hypothetical protein
MSINKSADIEPIDYNQLNLFKYFSHFSTFIALFNNKTDSLTQKESDTFIKSLCNIYIAHNIHMRITEEISKKTNVNILKGDYFFSQGYEKVANMGSLTLIKLYSRIAEYFARVSLMLN